MPEIFGGPDRDRTDDLFHAMEARSQLRHRPTCCVGCNSFIVAAGARFVKPTPVFRSHSLLFLFSRLGTLLAEPVSIDIETTPNEAHNRSEISIKMPNRRQLR